MEIAMPVTLSKHAREVKLDAADYQPMLENLQGNILKAHGRNCSWQVFLRFTGSEQEIRTWIRTQIAPNLFTAAEQYRQGQQPKGTDGGLVQLFFMSATGYEYLGFRPNRLRSKAFENGMKHQRNGPGETALSIHNKDPDPSSWEKGFQSQIDAMVVLADDQADRLQLALDALKQQLAQVAEILCVQEGKVLRRRRSDGADPADDEPIEHFGYFDGISQQ
jgi:deferrochelatase/peroxidase EfeB